MNIDRQIFDAAFDMWTSRAGLFETRKRLKRYTYGDQWGDMVVNAEGERLREGDWIMQTGRRPITNNLIRRLIKTIVGRYRDMATTNGWYESNPESIDSECELEELDSRLLEEFLISGMAIQRVANDNPLNEGRPDVTNVCPTRFFSNEFRDPRGKDIEILGMLHDMSPAEALLRFGGKGRKAGERLRQIIKASDLLTIPVSTTSTGFYAAAKGRIRIIEVWSREFDSHGTIKWKARWFAANGMLIDSYESPFFHKSHPFALKFYPLTDGEVHSFVEDVIEQQRYINRIIVLIDRILASSAKGVLLFPMSQKPKEMSWSEIGKRWAMPNGIIPIKGQDDLLPQQVGGTQADTSAYRLLEMELQMFDKSAGVGQALTGASGDSGKSTGAEHLQAQIENATIALADIFRTFRALIAHRDRKMKE